MEQKYQLGTQSGIIIWDISKMFTDNTNFNLRQFDVSTLIGMNNLSAVNREYAMTTDTNLPLMIVNLCGEKDKLIDGNHRLYKAMTLGIEKIWCYYLLPYEHRRYIVNYDSELYNQVVSEF